MAAPRADPVELRLGDVVGAEEFRRDVLELLVLTARRLVGSLIQSVGLVDDQQIPRLLALTRLERRHHLRWVQARCALEHSPDALPKRLLRDDQAHAEVLQCASMIVREEVGEDRIRIRFVVGFRCGDIGEQLHQVDGDHGLSRAWLALHDEQLTDALREVVEQSLHDVLDRDRLILRQGLVGRQFEEVAVLDLRNASGEDTLVSQGVEDLAERLAVHLAVVVGRVRDALVAVENPVGAVTGEQTDEVRLEVQADGLVEGVVERPPALASECCLPGESRCCSTRAPALSVSPT